MFDRERTKKYIKNIVPYKKIVDGDIVYNKNEMFFSVWELNCIDNNMEIEEAERRSRNVSSFFSQNFSKKYEFTFDFVRKVAASTELGLDKNIVIASENAGAKSIREKRQDFFENNTVILENQIFCSLCCNPGMIAGKRVVTNEEIEDFRIKAEILENAFSSFGFEAEKLKGDKLFTYLYNSAKNDFSIKEIKEPVGSLDEVLANKISYLPSFVPLMIDDNKLVQTVCLRALPYRTNALILTPLWNLNYPVRAIFKYKAYSHEESDSFIYKKRDKFTRSLFRPKELLRSSVKQTEFNDDEINLSHLAGKEGCNNALEFKKEAHLTSGDFSACFLLSSDKTFEKGLNMAFNVLSERLQDMQSMGVVLKKESLSNSYIYFANAFVGSSVVFKDGILHTLANSVGDFLPLTSFNEKYKSPYLEEITKSKEPLTYGLKLDNSLYRFSPFGKKEKGHTFITAPTRSGKSILLALFTNEWLKYNNTRLVYIDIGMSCLHSVLKNGGKMYCPLMDETTFQPFRNARDNVADCMAFIEAVCKANKIELSAKEANSISEIFSSSPEELKGQESFESIREAINGSVKDSSVAKALKTYETTYGNLFSSVNDSFDNLGRITGIELEFLFQSGNEAVKYPTLVYLLNKIEKQLSADKPTMIILDEAWRFLDDEYFCKFINQWLKTLGKKNAFVVIATQQITDITNSKIVNSILENSQTRIFLKNDHINEKSVLRTYTALGLNDTEIGIVKRMEDYWTLVKQDEKIVVCDFCASVCLSDLKTNEEEKAKYRMEIKKRKEEAENGND